MIAFQPEGPYYIGGYSHGGRVALEMALQLEAMGKKVAFLGIFDTSPCRRSQPPLTYLARWLRNLPLWFWFDARATTWQANVERVRRHGGWLRRVPFARSWLSAGRKHGGGSVPDIGAMMKVDQLPDAIRLMYQRDFEAFLHYQPTGRCSSVTLFRSRAQPLFGSHEPDLGWRAVCRGQVEVRHIVGNHSSILFRPHVEQLAAELRAALEAAQQQASAGESLARVPGRDERSPRRRDAA